MMGPPNKAAMKVVTWDKSRARDMLIGPSGIDGIMGEIVIESADRTFPKALITAMNTKVFEDREAVGNTSQRYRFYP